MVDFIPNADADKLVWLENLKSKVISNGGTFGLSDSKIDEVVQQCDQISAAILAAESKKTEQKAAVAHKKSVLKTNNAFLRSVINQIKTSDGYNLGVGKSLSIVGGRKQADKTSYTPKINLYISGGEVKIKFFKKGVDGINIYASKNGSSEFKLLSRATRSPFCHQIKLESEGQPEVWNYKAIGVIADHEIGQESAIAEIVFLD
jgi:hypothetical protein